jgi:membrane protein
MDDSNSGKSTPARKFLKELVLVWNAGQPAQAAAALAYYAMFSFAPILFIALTIAGIFLDELVASNELFTRLENTLGPETTKYILDAVDNVSRSNSGAGSLPSLIGFAVLLYAASGMFAQLQYALNTIWDVPPASRGGILASIKHRLLAFVMVIGLGLVLVIITISSLVMSVLESFVDLGGFAPAANFATVAGLAALTFALIYKVLPDARIAWRDVWAGAAITALLFSLARELFAFFLARSDFSSAFGAAGALAILLVTIYYMALIFLAGAVLTRAYATRFGSQAITRQPTGSES